jgi:hypothetical protein
VRLGAAMLLTATGCGGGGPAQLDAALVDATLVHVGDFEAAGAFDPGTTYPQFSTNIDTCEHDQTCATDSLELVTSPVRAGTRAVRVTLTAGDAQDTGGTRAELQTSGLFEQTLEEDYWYGFAIYLPEAWGDDPNDRKVVHQWHTARKQPGSSPILGLRLRGATWQLTRELADDESATTLWEGAAARGRWTDWVLHVRWSPAANGRLEVWRDGEQLLDETAANMHPGTSAGGHYQKFGMYGEFDGDLTERVLYYDELRVAVGPAGYALVDPGAAR